MGGVAPGSPVSASNTNSAFLEKNADDTTVGQVTLAKVDPTNAGPTVINTQGEINGLNTFAGRTAASGPGSLPSWTNNDVGTALDPVKTRADSLTQKFNFVSGHIHTGNPGDAPQINYLTGLIGPQLSGHLVQGTQIPTVSGGTTDVSTYLSGQNVSTGQTMEGVVVNTPQNIVNIFDQNGESILDGSGHKVYARLTNSGGPTGTWTLTYYSLVGGVETPYTFTIPQTNVNWYYQVLYNETNRPVYSDQIILNSDQIAGDIPTATTTLQGKVMLASGAPAGVGSSSSPGTANATVANADHVHQGVYSVSDGTNVAYGAIIFAGAGGTLVSLSGNTMTITGTVLGSATPQPIAGVGAVGTATAASREDHVHAGVHQITPQGGTAVLGDITLIPGNNVALSQPSAGQIQIDVGGFTGLRVQATLNDNQSSPVTITSWPQANALAILFMYNIRRGTGFSRTGTLIIDSDGTNVVTEDGPTTGVGDAGVTFSATISSGNINLQYTSTSTGVQPVLTGSATLIN